MLLFFLPFMLIGAGVLYFLTIHPLILIVTARSWVSVPCVIASSHVQTDTSGDSPTYHVGAVFRYQFDGRSYESTRHDFIPGSTSAKRARQFVARFPEGAETTCFVDPSDPQQAVLDRGLQQEMAFGGIGLIFLMAGLFGFFVVFRSGEKSSAVPTAGPRFGSDGLPLATGPTELKPKHTPVAKFFGMLLFAGLWNGFISIFVYLVFFAEDANKAPFFAKAIVGLFALIGVAIIVGVFTSFLALFNPRIRLTAQTTTVPLGGELQLTWKVSGRAGMLRKLRIIFEGREEATYRRGTSTHTDTQVFAEMPVFESTEREFLAQGSVRVVVPPNSMHTFEGRHNKVLWRLRVRGEIPRWPDVEDEYPITVLPQPTKT